MKQLRVKCKRDERKGIITDDDGFYVRVQYDNGDVGLYPSRRRNKWVIEIKEK
ncbi:unnamed protein product [marine sediment metagenome]|uniref:Uncharacterized protein n=1 Tax=marine sediment metagenome TaxID=412755 RepID=X1E331_9ZZZZ